MHIKPLFRNWRTNLLKVKSACQLPFKSISKIIHQVTLNKYTNDAKFTERRRIYGLNRNSDWQSCNCGNRCASTIRQTFKCMSLWRLFTLDYWILRNIHVLNSVQRRANQTLRRNHAPSNIVLTFRGFLLFSNLEIVLVSVAVFPASNDIVASRCGK